MLQLILREATYRWISFLLGTLAVAAGVAMCVALTITQEANQRETRRVTRDMGFNLRIVARDTDISQFLLREYSEHTLPEAALDTLANLKDVSYNHLVGVLQRPIQVADATAILMGITGERSPPGSEKSPMVTAVEAGKVELGHQIANQLGAKKGDSITVAGTSFQVARVAPAMGTSDDVRIVANLSDAQAILQMPGQINEIKAIDCLCIAQTENPQALLQAAIEKALPDAQVIMLGAIAEARARQRQTSEKYAVFVTTAMLAVVAIWLAALAIVNVRQRTSEMGILRALGYGSSSIGTLVLGRAALLGLLAGIIGYLAGTWLATHYGPAIFPVTAKGIKPMTSLLWWSLLYAPLFSIVASLIPAALAISQDPAHSLRNQE
ncbi:MAG: FtsX-like permease family protein [Pirellulaceae bacterium]